MAFIGKNIYLPVCWRGFIAMCWHKGNLLSFAWRWVEYDLSCLLSLLTVRNSETHNFPKSLPMVSKLRTDTHKWRGKWSLFLLFKLTYFYFTRKSNVLPYKILYHYVPPILSLTNLFSITNSKLGLPVVIQLYIHPMSNHALQTKSFSGTNDTR